MEDGLQGAQKIKKRKNPKAKKTEKSPEIWFSETEFKARQKLREDLPQRPIDIYVISQDLIQEQYLRALRLLRKEAVWVHSLGENIPVAITFLNKLKVELSADQLEVQTWCQTWEGLNDNWEFQSQRTGFNSGLHFKIIYKGAE